MTNGDNRHVNPLVAGVTGAAIGAGVAVLATKVLADKNMRDKVMQTAADIKERIAGSVHKAEKDITSTAHRIGISSRRRGAKMSFKRM